MFNMFVFPQYLQHFLKTFSFLFEEGSSLVAFFEVQQRFTFFDMFNKC